MSALRSLAVLTAAALLSACADRSEPLEAASTADSTPASTTTASTTAASGVPTYRVGEARVLALLDARAPLPAALFQGLSGDETARLLAAGGEATTDAAGKPAWAASVWAFLVHTGGSQVLVDTGFGGAMPGSGRLSQGLPAAGVSPADIDAVVISHMHGDHVGGLLDAAGRPRYPRARLFIHADEAGYWGDPAKGAAAPADQRETFAAARRILAAYGDRVRPFRGPASMATGFTAEPLPGHTPGHSVYRLRSGGREMVFVGDMIHSLAVQMPRPEVTLAFDSDADKARAARLAFLRANAGHNILFAGPHFRTGVVTIDKAGTGYKATPLAGQ